MVRNFFDRGEVLLSCVEMVNRHLVHCDVHYGRVAHVTVVVSHREILLVDWWRSLTRVTNYSTWILLLDLLRGLENGWQQWLILHEWRIVVFASDRLICNWWSHVVLKIRVEGLMLWVLDLQVSKVTPGVLSCKRPLLHINKVAAMFFLLGFREVITLIWKLALIKRTIRSIVAYFAHRFAVNRHRLVCLLSHPEDLAHLGWSGSCGSKSVHECLRLFTDAILLPELLKVWMFQSLGCC